MASAASRSRRRGSALQQRVLLAKPAAASESRRFAPQRGSQSIQQRRLSIPRIPDQASRNRHALQQTPSATAITHHTPACRGPWRPRTPTRRHTISEYLHFPRVSDASRFTAVTMAGRSSSSPRSISIETVRAVLPHTAHQGRSPPAFGFSRQRFLTLGATTISYRLIRPNSSGDRGSAPASRSRGCGGVSC